MSDTNVPMRHKGRPRIGPDRSAPETQGTGLIAQAIEISGRKYEQRYTRCGKKCNTCDPDSPEFNKKRPGHGPYWYFIFTRKDGRLTRRYIGKQLNLENNDPNAGFRKPSKFGIGGSKNGDQS